MLTVSLQSSRENDAGKLRVLPEESECKNAILQQRRLDYVIDIENWTMQWIVVLDVQKKGT